MKVMLLNPPYKPTFIRSARSTWPSISGSNWYPIFLAYATSWLRKHGHEAKLVDALVANISGGEVVQIAEEFKPDILALYISEQSLESDVFVGEKIKKKVGCEIVLVGPWCAVEPEKILQRHKMIDAVVRREFDDVLLDLVEGKEKRRINGLIFRDGEKIVSNPEREFLTADELDEFPFVTKIYKEFLPIDKYYQASLLHPFVDLFTGRGCVWGKCTFCLWPNTIHKGANPYRLRSIENVVEELKFIKRELPFVKEVFFQDDTLPAFRAREIAEAILKEGLKMTWSCYVRANVDLGTLKLMKKAGCRYLHVGYESPEPVILKNICKGTDPAAMKKFSEDTKRVGLKVHGDFIIGLPGETEETIKRTIAWAKDLGIEGYQFFIPQLQKGTPLYDYLIKKKYLTKKGEVNYPHLTHGKLNYWRFRAMRSIYSSPKYVFNTIRNIESLDDLLRLLRTARYALPNIFGK